MVGKLSKSDETNSGRCLPMNYQLERFACVGSEATCQAQVWPPNCGVTRSTDKEVYHARRYFSCKPDGSLNTTTMFPLQVSCCFVALECYHRI